MSRTVLASQANRPITATATTGRQQLGPSYWQPKTGLPLLASEVEGWSPARRSRGALPARSHLGGDDQTMNDALSEVFNAYPKGNADSRRQVSGAAFVSVLARQMGCLTD